MLEPGPDFDALLNRAKSGDGSALFELLWLHRNRVRMMARVHLRQAGRDLAESEELVQSVFKDIVHGVVNERINVFGLEELLRLANKVVHHKVCNLVRKRAIQARRFGSALTEEALARLESSEPDPARVVEDRDLLDAMRRRLSLDDQLLLDLRQQGVSYIEIAEQLHTSPKAARMRWSRLRQSLEDDDQFGM